MDHVGVKRWDEGRQPVAGDIYRQALRALTTHTAVLDRAGSIVVVNDAWEAFARDNGAAGSPAIGVGANYFDVCRKAMSGEPDAAHVLQGIRSVLSGELPLFEYEYACHGNGEQRWFLATVAPLGPAAISGAIVTHHNVTARKIAEIALRASEERFRSAFDHAAAGIGEMNADGSWRSANGRLCEITGYDRDRLLSMSLWDIVHPGDLDSGKTQFEVMRAAGNSPGRMEQRLVQPDGSIIWVVITLGCVNKSSGGIDYYIAGVEDVSAQKMIERRQQTLLQELAHRGKNLLAVIKSLAGRSLTGERTLAEARVAFGGRLDALSKTYEVLTDAAFDGVLLDAVLRNELASFEGQIHVRGPSILLTEKATQTMALVSHELATNSAKYGALLVPEGRLQIMWEVSGEETDRRLLFDWRETGGPAVQPPTRRGFGTTLITQIAGSDFDCKPETNYHADGFHYRFEAPLDRLGVMPVESAVRRRLRNSIVCSLFDAWARQRPARGLPSLAGFDWSRFAATGALTIANIEPDGDIHFVQIGRALTERLGTSAGEAAEWANEDVKNLIDVYRRCAQGGEPCHELMRMDFADGVPFTFERLLVPFAAMGGRAASHVVGIVVMEGDTKPERIG